MERRNGANQAAIERDQLRYTPKLDNATSCEWTTEGSGHGRAGASDNVPIMCRSNRCDGAWASG